MGERRELAPAEDLDPVVENGTVLVDFQADWCAPCAVLDEFVDEVIDDLDALVLSVDVEEHAALVDAYDVTTNPTMVVFEDGEEVERIVGLPDRERFRELLAPWLYD